MCFPQFRHPKFWTQTWFIIRHYFTCTFSKITYCVSCSTCCKIYIGETGRRLSDRFPEQLHSVKSNDVDKPVSHFNLMVPTIRFQTWKFMRFYQLPIMSSTHVQTHKKSHDCDVSLNGTNTHWLFSINFLLVSTPQTKLIIKKFLNQRIKVCFSSHLKNLTVRALFGCRLVLWVTDKLLQLTKNYFTTTISTYKKAKNNLYLHSEAKHNAIYIYIYIYIYI